MSAVNYESSLFPFWSDYLEQQNFSVDYLLNLLVADGILDAEQCKPFYDSSSDVYPTSEYFASTEPDGDNNAAIYCTKQIQLEQKATALKVLHSANRGSDAEIKVIILNRKQLQY